MQKLFLRPFVQRRMANSHLGIILEQFALDLEARGYAVSTIQSYVQVTEHLSRWLGQRRLAIAAPAEEAALGGLQVWDQWQRKPAGRSL